LKSIVKASIQYEVSVGMPIAKLYNTAFKVFRTYTSYLQEQSSIANVADNFEAWTCDRCTSASEMCEK